jgi:hypothetical protein
MSGAVEACVLAAWAEQTKKMGIRPLREKIEHYDHSKWSAT